MTPAPRSNWGKNPAQKRPPEYWRNRAITLREAGNRCAVRLEGVCTGLATVTDHIAPRSTGIDEVQPDDVKVIRWLDKAAGITIDDLSNLRAACVECNTELNYRQRPKPKPKTLRRSPEKHPGLL